MAEDNAMNPKVSGYLEKKSKMKMMNSYKRYWFVLEGRLLLYYRSKEEYEAISPCKGSINLGPACNIKTCPSTSGVYVFQIETRTSTTTLRADNREDQNRWMQGIMSALNQNKNAKKLSHFRYSLDELSQQAPNKNALRRKNTILPQSDSSKNQSDNDKGIIRRLQKIGAHSYGGSMGAINQIESKSRKANSSTETENLSSFRSSVSVDNNQYGMLKKNTNSENTEIRKGPRLNENIYERILGDSSISINSRKVNYCIRDQTNINYNETSAINTKIMSCEQKSYDINDTENNSSRPTTFLLENETYGGIPLNSENNDSQNRIRQTSFILENNQYCDIEKIIKFPNTDSEIIYAEPKCSSATDHNKNNLTLNKIKGEENAYSIIKLYDSEKNTVNNQYEDTKKCGDYSEAKYQSKENTKLKKQKSENQSKTIISENKKEFKLKKSSSFINRVWRKKKKHKEMHTEELYETIPDFPADKIGFSDDVAVQMLSELQNLLENKMPLLLEVTPESHATETLRVDLRQNKANPPCSSKSENHFLPVKHHSSTYSSYNDIPNNNQLVPLPPKKKQNMNTVSLDKILDDLEKEKKEDFTKCKVKKLIKQFSGSDSECDVELWTNKRSDFSREDVDSNKLSRLLDELVKVTCAPILTPGLTSSLISTNLIDEEIIKLLPTRQRRHSDSDYDVPIPHKSLINLPKKENSPENIIGSTRFFGPILNSTDNNSNYEPNLDNPLQMLSMTPDSLEPISMQLEKCTTVPHAWGDNKNAHSSQNYILLKHRIINDKQIDGTFKKTILSTNDDSMKCYGEYEMDMVIENDIYAQPKLLYDSNIIKENNIKISNLIDNCKLSDENLEDVFIDSLEIENNDTSSH